MQVFYCSDYVAAGYSFETTRKAAWVAESLYADPIAGAEIIAPPSVSEPELSEVHSSDYISAVKVGTPRELAESQGFTWDPSLWQAVCSSTGGVVAAVHAALRDGAAGSLSSGLHHARFAKGAGYCTFNGLALAARVAANMGVGPILILDLDAHCGGGTHSLIANMTEVRHADLAVSSFDRYIPASNNRFEFVSLASQYLRTTRQILNGLERRDQFKLCLYNAGMDPHESCPIGGLRGITSDILAERERMVFDWCRARGCPIAFVLAGGYVGAQLGKQEIVALHRLTIGAAATVK